MEDLHNSARDELEKALEEVDQLLEVFIASVSDLTRAIEDVEASEMWQQRSSTSPFQA